MYVGVEIAVNEDWASARRRLEAFWAHEIIDRPCLQVYVPSRSETSETDVGAEGKGLYVGSGDCGPDEAILLLKELRPEGLIIPVTARDKDEGRRLLERVQKLC